MNESNVYLKPNHPYAYKRGKEFPLVTGVVGYTPKGLTERLCYKVEYRDGFIDYVPIVEVNTGHYSLIMY